MAINKTVRLFIIFLFSIERVFSTAYSWTGNSSTDWNISTNWSPIGIPNSSGDSATISSVTNEPAIGIGESYTVGSLTFSGGGTLLLTGGLDVQGGSVTGGGVVTISGTGTLAFDNGSKTFVPNLTLNGGGLSNDGQLHIEGLVIVSADSSLSSTVSGQSITTVDLLQGNNGKTLTLSGSGTNSLSSIDVEGNDEFTVEGVIGGVAPVTKSGSGILILNGLNTYTGNTTIIQGTILAGGPSVFSPNSAMALYDQPGVTLDLGGFNNEIGSLSSGGTTGGIVQLGAGQLTVGANGVSTTFDGAISGTGGSIVKTGSGTLSLTATNTYTGTTTIQSGSIILTGSGTLGSGAAVVINGTATLDITGISGGSVTIGDLTTAAGSTINLGNKNLSFGNTQNTTIAGQLTGGGGSIIKQGSGTVTLSAGNTYTGGTTIYNGALSISNQLNVGGPNADILFNNTGVLQVTATGTYALNLNITAFGTIFVDSAVTATFSNPITGTASDGQRIFIDGSGTVAFSATNNYNLTTVLSGTGVTLKSDALGAFSPNSDFQIIEPNATLDLNGNDSTISSLFSIDDNTILTSLGSNTLTLSGNLTNSYGGVISGSGGSIVKNGIGIFTLTAANTYNGGTVINGSGAIVLSGSGALSSSGALTINSTGQENFYNFDISGISGAGTSIGGLTTAATSKINLGSKTLTFGGSSSTTVSGIIDGTNGSITKQGSGTATFTAVNTYTGTTTVNAGSLALTGVGSLGSAGAVSVNGTSTLDISGISPSSITIGDLSSVFGSTVNLGSKSLVLGTANSTTVAGVIIGNGGSVTKQGTGTVTLSGSNTYTGDTTITEGEMLAGGEDVFCSDSAMILYNEAGVTLDLGNFNNTIASLSGGGANGGIVDVGSAQLTLGGNSLSTSFDGVISGTNGSIVKEGSGTLTLGGLNTYTGTTTINIGAIALTGNGSISSDLTLVGTSTFDISGISSSFITIQDLSSVSGTTINLGGNGLVFGAINDTNVAALITGTNGSITKNGTGTVTLSEANTYSGGTTITAGTLSISSENNIGGSTGAITLGGGTLSSTGNVTSSAAIDVTDNSTLSTASTFTTALTGTLTGLGGKTLTLSGTGTNSLSIVKVDAADTFTVAGVIGGVNSLTKLGSGTLILSGTNTFSGGVTISAGQVTLSNNSGLGTGALTIDAGTTLALQSGISVTNGITLSGADIVDIESGTGTLSGNISGSGGSITKNGSGTLVLSGTNTFNGGVNLTAGQITLGSNSGLGTGPVSMAGTTTLALQNGISATNSIVLGGLDRINVVSGVATLSETISGAGGSLVKNGSGTLVLSGTNTFNGNTTIALGTLSVATGSNLGGGPNLIFSGGNLLVTGNLTTNKTVRVTANASITTNNGLTTDLTGAVIGSPGATLTLNGPGVNSLSTVEVSSGTFTINGVIGGTNTLTKTSAGTLSLLGANTYTGGTVVNRGTVHLSGGGSLLNTGAVTLHSSSIFDVSGISGSGITIGDLATDSAARVLLGNKSLQFGTANSTTIAGMITGIGASVVKQGSGSVTFSGANTYSGGTTISGGALIGNTTSLQGDILNNAALQFNQGSNGTYVGSISGNGANQFIIGNGQVLSFTGNSGSFSGTNDIQAGALNLNGFLGGTTTVDSTGILTGNGQLVTVINNGRIAPGNSIGTINITGDYTQGAGGFYDVEINPAGASDLLAITGAANLNGSVTLTPIPGFYLEGTQYTILTAGSIAGTFSTLVEDPILQYQLLYLTGSVLLELTSSVIVTPVPNSLLKGNERAVADYLFCDHFDAPVGSDLYNIVTSLLFVSPSEYIAALQQLAPTQYSALPLLELENNSRIIDCYTGRIKKLLEYSFEIENYGGYQNRELWADGLAFFYRQGALAEQIGFDAQTYGVTVGGGKSFKNSLALGFAGSYTYSHLKWNQGQGNSRSNAFYLGPFLSWHQKAFYLETAMLGAVNFYKNKRVIAYPGLYRVATNDHNDWNITNSVDLGSKIYLARCVFLEPLLQVFFVQSFQNAISEKGAESLDLYVEKNFTSFIRGTFDLSLGIDFYRKKDSIVTTEFMIGWMDTTQLTSGKYTSNMIGATTCEPNFTVSGYDASPMQIHYGVSLTGKIKEDFAFGVIYNGTSLSHNSVQELQCKFQYNF